LDHNHPFSSLFRPPGNSFIFAGLQKGAGLWLRHCFCSFIAAGIDYKQSFIADTCDFSAKMVLMATQGIFVTSTTIIKHTLKPDNT